MDAIDKAYLTLALSPGLGPRKIKLLCEHVGDAERVLMASRRELLDVPGIGAKLADSILKQPATQEAEHELARADKLGVTLLTPAHASYPEALRQIYDPPAVLYLRGQLPEALYGELSQVRAVAIVGTRNPSDYGRELSARLARSLAEAGVSVISGLALGVDGAAHQAALEVDSGTTVAVLGSGVDIIYPRQHQALAKRIASGRGAVVSEYRLGSQPKAEHFPGRNRIISGFSRGAVVVEGGVRSGALITAEYALDEGRSVFAVPGRAGDPKAAGTLALLRQGAILTQGPEDILDEFGWRAAATQGGSEPRRSALDNLSEPQRSVVHAILTHGSPLLDDLVLSTGKSAAELLPLLTLLELQGAVRPLPGGRYMCLLPA